MKDSGSKGLGHEGLWFVGIGLEGLGFEGLGLERRTVVGVDPLWRPRALSGTIPKFDC